MNQLCKNAPSRLIDFLILVFLLNEFKTNYTKMQRNITRLVFFNWKCLLYGHFLFWTVGKHSEYILATLKAFLTTVFSNILWLLDIYQWTDWRRDRFFLKIIILDERTTFVWSYKSSINVTVLMRRCIGPNVLSVLSLQNRFKTKQMKMPTKVTRLIKLFVKVYICCLCLK